jgi:uncharacterized Rossmann fold enzyme
MEYPEWEPVYEAIRADFGYDRAADERARDLLAELVAEASPSAADSDSIGGTYRPDRLGVAGATVAVAGAGPSLATDFDIVREAEVVFAASTAADTIQEAGLAVDCMVTDLDKNPGTARRLTREGVPVAVHAHGDNVGALRTVVPTLDPPSVVPTTQVEPVAGVWNFGGFTDGDRAAFMADHLGAGELVFAGWDFDDATVAEAKARKLTWAERLLYWLERRRDERFGVLEGRRAAIETAPLPVD